MNDVDLPEGVTVILVNKFNKTQELKRKTGVKTKNGRIPLRDICKEWNLRNVIWVETDDPVTFDEKTGWSSISFAFMDEVILKGDISLINQEKLAKEFMDQQFKKKPLTSSQTSKSKGLDIVVETEEKVLHPNIVKKNALNSLVKKTQGGEQQPSTPPKSSSTSTTTATTTSTPIVVTSSPVIVEKKTVASVNVSTPTKSTTTNTEDSLAQIEKLAALKEKGILTEEEFKAKKKQLLGL